VDVTLLEIDPELSELAGGNAERNGLAERVRAVNLDVTAPSDQFAACGIGPASMDCVLMNPPFNNPARQNVSRDADRRAAHAAGEGLLDAWIGAANWVLHSAGTLTLIWRADGLADVLAALGDRFGDIAVLPVHGRAGSPAIRVLVSARKGSRAPLTLLPGLNLNDETGKPTAEAEAVLRAAQALPRASVP
jgi:tRNA1(Val) A37 N6-methylase TrmN6